MLATPRTGRSSDTIGAPPAPPPDGQASGGQPAPAFGPHGGADPADRPSCDWATRMYEQHHAELYRAAMRACRDSEAAEDLVQEAFLRLVVEIGRDRTPDNVRAWLHRVIANLAVSAGRRAAVSQKFAPALVNRDEPATPEAIALDEERRSDLASALDALPAGARTALLLAAQGFSGTEIAAAIGRTDCATRTLMCRARITVRERMVAAAAGSRGPADTVLVSGPARSADARRPVPAAAM